MNNSNLNRDKVGPILLSEQEIKAALKTGFSAPQIVFTGPGKTNLELATAIETGIGIIVVESVNEARRLNNLAQKYGKKQDVLIRPLI